MMRQVTPPTATMSRSPEDLIPKKPESRLHIYAYSIADKAHDGLLKIGQTTQDVKTRVSQQLQTAVITNYAIELDEPAERSDATLFTDYEVRGRLAAKGFERATLEWMRCSVADVLTAITELRTGQTLTGTHHETFSMRPEQEAAVDKTVAYFSSIWAESPGAAPRFLWNAKMRFGKTFSAYQLAKRLFVNAAVSLEGSDQGGAASAQFHGA